MTPPWSSQVRLPPSCGAFTSQFSPKSKCDALMIGWSVSTTTADAGPTVVTAAALAAAVTRPTAARRLSRRRRALRVSVLVVPVLVLVLVLVMAVLLGVLTGRDLRSGPHHAGHTSG